MNAAMPSSHLPPEALEFFRKHGAVGGKIGGKKAAAAMTPEARKERARMGGIAANAARRARLETEKAPEGGTDPAEASTPRPRVKK